MAMSNIGLEPEKLSEESKTSYDFIGSIPAEIEVYPSVS